MSRAGEEPAFENEWRTRKDDPSKTSKELYLITWTEYRLCRDPRPHPMHTHLLPYGDYH